MRPCAIKYFWTRSPYDEWWSGAAISSEHERGNPPPSMSSKEGIPVDIKVVEDAPGNDLAPAWVNACFAVALRLKEDIEAKYTYSMPIPSWLAQRFTANRLTSGSKYFATRILGVRVKL